MRDKIKVTNEFETEAKRVAEFNRELLFLGEEQIKSLFKKAKDEGWYSGPSFIVEDLLYDYCLNKTTQRSWSNYCGADIISSVEENNSLE